MARRGKSKSALPLVLTLVGIGLLLLSAIVALFFIMNRAKDPYTGITEFSVRDYLDDANSLRGNVYRLTGRVDERLDDWRSGEGRLFSVKINDGFGSVDPVPVHVPSSFNSENIQRDQEYLFKVKVGEGGLLVAEELRKS